METRKQYLPSNGTEGMEFESLWCDRCARNPIKQDAKTQCVHLYRALCGEDNGKWFCNGTGAGECTAFRSRAEANKRRRSRVDGKQMTLFWR